VFGYQVHALEHAGWEQPLPRMPLPATYILRVCALGLSMPDTYLQLQCAGRVFTYVLLNRPLAAACMRRCEVTFTPVGMELQAVDFKLALRTGSERLAFTVPTDWEGSKVDNVARLLPLVVERHDAAGRHLLAMLFADPALPSSLRRYWLAARATNKWLQRVRKAFPSQSRSAAATRGTPFAPVPGPRRTPSSSRCR